MGVRRLLAVSLVTALTLSALALPATGSTSGELEAEAGFLAAINEDRALEGLEPLAPFWDITDDARAQSVFQAEGNCPGEELICHNENLAAVTEEAWTLLGENVGVGPNVPVLHQAFMDSPGHRANILGDFDYVGIGVVIDELGRMFVTVVFMQGPEGLPAVNPAEGPVYEFPTGADRVGQQDPVTGVWSLVTAEAVEDFYYGVPSDLPVTCDWDGDGVDTVGLYRSWTGFLHLRNSNTQGFSDIEIFYGVPSDLPVCGDWDGDGVESIGIFRAAEGRFYLRNTNTQGFADVDFLFGQAGDVPLAGDWDGDGVDTVAVYRPSAGQVIVAAGHSPAIAAVVDRPDLDDGDRLVVGDWDADGTDTVGYYRPSHAAFHLSNDLVTWSEEGIVPFGDSTHNVVAGHWG